ncbi:MAG: NAD(P)-dependent oxidoreductase [Rhodanobacteraceae bacterium]|jgi:3-hydroxyisobutyrate dehydrogenase|nr:NAD(P)-dependent oxidoreductase [Rhodanobacteraceae bacterium]
MSIGFLGIGTMGLPMAGRLLSAGFPLRVWNRTPGRCEPLIAKGAVEAASVDDLFANCTTVLVMLLNQEAVDATLQRGLPAFARRMPGRTLVMLGTTSPEYSAELEADVRRHGGRYVEAPVSGSRGPAEEGALIGMVAGEPQTVADIEPLLLPLCRQVVGCGPVPAALRLKLAVNHYLIVLVAALAEATKAAAASGVDLERFRDVLDAGPMASTVSRAKLHKLVSGDFSPQAAIRDVGQIACLVRDQARSAGVDAHLIDVATRMFATARRHGLSDLDMAAVLECNQTESLLELP